MRESQEASVMVRETLAWVWETDCSLSPGGLAVCQFSVELGIAS